MDAPEQGRRSLVGASRAARGEVVGARPAANCCDSASLGAAPNGSEGSESALADLIGTDAAALAWPTTSTPCATACSASAEARRERDDECPGGARGRDRRRRHGTARPGHGRTCRGHGGTCRCHGR
ncbi:hypothetical protein B9W62_04645, partial [Streptomyces sp. CS113]